MPDPKKPAEVPPVDPQEDAPGQQPDTEVFTPPGGDPPPPPPPPPGR